MQWHFTCFSLSLCCWVPSDGSSRPHQARCKNPDHQGGSKHFRTTNGTLASSRGPPRRNVNTTTSKPKEKEKYTPPDEMSAKEIEVLHVRNPYRRALDATFVGRPFRNKEQSLIYLDILKAKKNVHQRQVY